MDEMKMIKAEKNFTCFFRQSYFGQNLYIDMNIL